MNYLDERKKNRIKSKCWNNVNGDIHNVFRDGLDTNESDFFRTTKKAVASYLV